MQKSAYDENYEDGFEKGLEKGLEIKLIKLVCKKIINGKLPEQIADELDEADTHNHHPNSYPQPKLLK